MWGWGEGVIRGGDFEASKLPIDQHITQYTIKPLTFINYCLGKQTQNEAIWYGNLHHNRE